MMDYKLVKSEANNCFEKIKPSLNNFFKDYSNKSKILNLLEFWLFSVFSIYLTYGKDGLKSFIDGEVVSPLCFSFREEFNAKRNVTLEKSYAKNFVYSLLISFTRKLYVPGAPISNIFMKINNRIALNFIKTLSFERREDSSVLNQALISYLKVLDIKCNHEDFLKNVPLIFKSKQKNLLNLTNISLEGSAASFTDFCGYEEVLLIQSKIHFTGHQHGAGYGCMKDGDNIFEDFEMKFYDKFYGWGLSKNNLHQKRFKNKFSHRDFSIKDRKIYWLESGLQPKLFRIYENSSYMQSIDFKSKDYIYSELCKSGFNYINLSHPHTFGDIYRSYRKDLQENENNENIINNSDVVIFDNVHSTLIHYCLENNIPYFIVIDEGMMVNFSKKMTKWMLELKKSKRLFFNHEKDSLYMALINLPKIHKDLDDYYKKLI
tara:strand:+ start:8382 stop:9677 length:1296 start_codon:yes stop_codon:yes gene_type:complete